MREGDRGWKNRTGQDGIIGPRCSKSRCIECRPVMSGDVDLGWRNRTSEEVLIRLGTFASFPLLAAKIAEFVLAATSVLNELGSRLRVRIRGAYLM